MTLTIDTEGNCRALYSEEFDLVALGPATITRASHVEPVAAGCGWVADMSPVAGPLLGPFAKRSEALRAEVAWIERNVL